MFVKLVASSSISTCENQTLIVYNTYFRRLSDYNCPENYRNLSIIHLGSNNLSSLEGTGVSDVSGLLHLVVVHNLLASLDPRLLSNLSKLISLDLSYNKLESLKNEHLFTSQSKLEVLRLSYNQIVTLDLRVLVPLHAIKELNLSGNPFCCDCELRYTVKWCEERNLNTGAACENGVAWADFSYENCTSVTFIVIGIAIGIVIIVSVLVEMWVCCLRRTRSGTTGTEPASSEETLENLALICDHTTPRNRQRCTSSCSNHSRLFKPAEISSSQEYAKIIRRQAVQHRGTEAGFTMPHTYAEPYQHQTDASEIYAEPYHQTAAKTEGSNTLDKNVLCTELNMEIYPDEISVTNSLYSKL